ncbi:thermonuclease family protein [Ruegeria sp. HKCCD4332]|uniref:thermonuclease family protein n=1 Tax=Ruegeria sp. HKCCD4332 TaxID=2683021 RepID=UPI0014911151|nr:thermonuclease family protein [Ruegeria sp. HKCCD4332]
MIAVDGDTIDHGDDRYRLVGFDAPETFRAQCDAEKALGLRAKDRLREIIQTNGQVELEINPEMDRYGRLLATARVSGKEVGSILISEGLARPYAGGKRGSWCG